jgi:alpha-tubulin suppressor-like RCC1 family protein
MAISTKGYLYSTGCSQYGQLGNGETGEYFVTANKLAFTNCPVWTRRSTFCDGPAEDKITPLSESVLVRQVACGKHHTLVVEAAASNAKARIFSFGCGDYGCLGHGVQKDEYFPRNITGFVNAAFGDDDAQVKVAAGNSCSLLLTSTGHVYYWGKHRSVGEAVMRPQLNDVLANNQHIVQHVAAGSQTIVCATAHGQTVVSGQGPHGELGLKSGAKSSAKITFVDDLNGCQVQSVAASYGSLLYVVRDGTDSEEQKAVNDLPKLEKMDVMELMDRGSGTTDTLGSVAKGGSKKGRKRKA